MNLMPEMTRKITKIVIFHSLPVTKTSWTNYTLIVYQRNVEKKFTIPLKTHSRERKSITTTHAT